jgi:hypothetical protein
MNLETVNGGFFDVSLPVKRTDLYICSTVLLSLIFPLHMVNLLPFGSLEIAIDKKPLPNVSGIDKRKLDQQKLHNGKAILIYWR